MMGGVNDQSDRWADVAEAVRSRMLQLGILDKASLQRASGLSEPTIRSILDGAPRGRPRGRSRIQLARALEWSDDSIDRLLRGEPPKPAPQVVVGQVAELDLREMAVQLLDGNDVDEATQALIASLLRRTLVTDEEPAGSWARESARRDLEIALRSARAEMGLRAEIRQLRSELLELAVEVRRRGELQGADDELPPAATPSDRSADGSSQ